MLSRRHNRQVAGGFIVLNSQFHTPFPLYIVFPYQIARASLRASSISSRIVSFDYLHFLSDYKEIEDLWQHSSRQWYTSRFTLTPHFSAVMWVG